MDADRFDTLARMLAAVGSRRPVLAATLGGAFGILGLADAVDVRAGGKCKPKCAECKKCKKGKNGKKGKCKSTGNGKACSVGTCQSGRCVAPPTCPGQTTCPAGFSPSCCPPDAPNCCSPAEGSGCCTAGFPGCCSPAQGGGCCPAAFPLCCDLTAESGCCANDEHCCPGGTGPLFGCCPLTAPVCCVDPDAGNGGCCDVDHANCCSVDEGGGCCPNGRPACCEPTPDVPEGACCRFAEDCCTVDGDCDLGDTCQGGCCAAPGAGALGEPSQRRHTRQVTGTHENRDAAEATSRGRAARVHQRAD